MGAQGEKTERAMWVLALAMQRNGAVFPGRNLIGGSLYRVTSAQFDRFVRIHGLTVKTSPDGGRMAVLP